MKQPETRETVCIICSSHVNRFAFALSISDFKQCISKDVDSMLAKFVLFGERIAKFEKAVHQILSKYYADGWRFYGDGLLMSCAAAHQWVMELLHDHQYLHEKPTTI